MWLCVSTEPPYASFDFQAEGASCDVLSLRSVCQVLDYIGRCGEGLATYEWNPDGSFLVYPLEGRMPSFDDEDDDGGSELAQIVAYVRSLGSA